MANTKKHVKEIENRLKEAKIHIDGLLKPGRKCRQKYGDVVAASRNIARATEGYENAGTTKDLMLDLKLSLLKDQIVSLRKTLQRLQTEVRDSCIK